MPPLTVVLRAQPQARATLEHMSARRITLACASALAVAAPAAALAATPKQSPPPAAGVPGARIAPGISAGGVDLSGLTVTEATGRLRSALGPHLARPVAVDVGGETFRLTVKDAKFVFDANATAKAAVVRPAPAPATVGGVGSDGNVPLVLSHSTTAVRIFVSQVARAARRAARNATLKITLKHMIKRRSKPGYRLDQAKAYAAINAAWRDAAASRKIRQKLIEVRAKVNANDLAKRYPTVVTVQKSTRTLRLFKGLKISKRYKVAIGQPAYPTPEGLFAVQSKQINPVWSVPNSPWAGELAGTTVTGGSAANPLKARWIGVTGSVGFHGTGDDASIGSAASHGCMRMHVPDVIDLYKRVSVGTPVLIG